MALCAIVRSFGDFRCSGASAISWFVLFSFSRRVSNLASGMKAVLVEEYGGPEKLLLKDVAKPVPSDHQVLIRIHASAVNRADCVQRRGKYPVPKGESDVLGLEASGVIEEMGQQVKNFKIGDRVMALLGGGGYAEYATAHHGHVMKIPENLDFASAAAIPEVFLTAYQLMHFLGHVKRNEKVLVHAAGSGVGTALIQLSNLMNAESFATAGSSDKLQRIKELGAHHTVNYKEEDFSDVVVRETNGRGVDLILDPVGASYWEKNIKSIALDGRWVLYGLLGGGGIDGPILAKLMGKRVHLLSTTLRARSLDYKTELVSAFSRDILPKFASGEVKPIVDTIFALEDIVAAHRYVEDNKNFGKVVIKVHDGDKRDEL